MKYTVSTFALLIVILALGSCSDTLLVENASTKSFVPRGEQVDVTLDLSVQDLVYVATRGDGDVSDDTEAERRISDVWVFQYAADDGEIVSEPVYKDLTAQTDLEDLTNIDVTLRDNLGNPSVVYVVANTKSSTWVSDMTSYTGFETLDNLKMHAIPNPAPIRIVTTESETEVEGTTTEAKLAIPMSGSVGEDGSLTVREGYRITVPVARMFAKMEMYVTLKTTDEYEDEYVTNFMVEKIPNTAMVATTYTTGDDSKWYYPDVSSSNYEISRNFVPDRETTSTGGDSDEIEYGPFLLYVPENIQGTDSTNALKLTPSIYVKEKQYDAEIISRPTYTVYPGSWDYSYQNQQYGANLNIKRNSYYRVKILVTPSDTYVTPSANCLIASAGSTVAFYPYVRDEEPSDEMKADANYETTYKSRYDFTTYLNAYDETGDKTISSVKIIWQTYNCIGNNTSGNLVWIDDAPSAEDYSTNDERGLLEYQRKIYVKAANVGNALIGAFNKDGVVLWSWHIWVPDADPENDAIEYYHYKWDTNGIQTNVFEPGRLVMRLSLGALKEYPTTAGTVDFRTYGTLYQWGRKDPFPPVTSRNKNYTALTSVTKGSSPYFYNYANDATNVSGAYTIHVGVSGDADSGSSYTSTGTSTGYGVFDNGMNSIDLSDYTGAIGSRVSDMYKLKFNTNSSVPSIGGTLGAEDDAVIKATIQDPTMFVAAAAYFSSNGTGTDESNNIGSYYNNGDWLQTGDDFLWGGGHVSTSGEYQVYSQENGDAVDAYLEDDYGPNKTIFDPCPYGWRISPGDLWLGFTKDGLNWWHNSTTLTPDTYWNDINCADADMNTVNSQNGYTMYMQGWRSGVTSFFPVQPARVPSGQPYLNGGICGNYHNATVDREMYGTSWDGASIRRVDIIHFHAQSSTYGGIRPFTTELYYYTKAVAGPVRCVRDTK